MDELEIKIDEYNTPPGKNSSENLLSRDILGNKTDD
jgi:hypothetical protein